MSTNAAAAMVALVADDDVVIRRLLTMLLEREGFEVHEAPDGRTALGKVRVARPALVFLDAHMPELDGYQVCRRIREETAGAATPFVIMLTAAGQEADRQRAEDAGVNEFVTKPFSPSKLATRLRNLRVAT